MINTDKIHHITAKDLAENDVFIVSPFAFGHAWITRCDGKITEADVKPPHFFKLVPKERTE